MWYSVTTFFSLDVDHSEHPINKAIYESPCNNSITLLRLHIYKLLYLHYPIQIVALHYTASFNTCFTKTGAIKWWTIISSKQKDHGHQQFSSSFIYSFFAPPSIRINTQHNEKSITSRFPRQQRLQIRVRLFGRENMSITRLDISAWQIICPLL